MSAADLSQVAVADLQGAGSIEALADGEGWTPDMYALVLSEHIRASNVPLDVQRERLAALTGIGAALVADRATADELARHFSILESLFHRFSRASFEALGQPGPKASEIAERYLGAALRAQRAAMGCLSALNVLRDGARAGSPPGVDGSAE